MLERVIYGEMGGLCFMARSEGRSKQTSQEKETMMKFSFAPICGMLVAG